jgi:hypothetical protein
MPIVPILPPSFVLFLGTLGLALHLFLALQVFRSASEHGMHAAGWTTLYFFTGPLGWILFMLARDASLIGGSSAAPARNGSERERVVDQRSGDITGNRAMAFPRPSEDFHDPHLADLVSSGDWEAARAHALDMMSVAKEEGDHRLAEDYSRALPLIDARRWPFAKR